MSLREFVFRSRKTTSPEKKVRKDYRHLTIRPDDVFLVSYPKSGNTWLRFLLGYYFKGDECGFETIDRIIPDIHFDVSSCDMMEGPRFLKSHFPYSPLYDTASYPRVVYVIRDGRDVAVSYYYYLLRVGKLNSHITFEEAIPVLNHGTLDPYANWGMHVNSWLDAPVEHFLLIRYEDMKQDSAAVLKRVLTFAGVPIDEDLIERAVKQSEFQSLKKKEMNLKSSWRGESKGSQIPFMREGTVQGWKKHFSPESAKAFYNFHRSAFERLGYEEIPSDSSTA